MSNLCGLLFLYHQDMLKLYKELKRRKVLKTLGVYGAAALVIINIATGAFPYLNLPIGQ